MEGKTKVSKKTKRELIKRISMIVISGVLLVFVSGYSFGWFAMGGRVNPGSMQIRISTDSYNLLVERTTEYDAGYNYIAGTGEAKDKLAAAGYDLTETDTADASKIAYEMVSEYNYENKKYLMPGAYGTVTFYLRPVEDSGDFIANFTLTFGGYVANYDEDEEEHIIEPVESENVLNMMKGHILFFTGRTGEGHANYKYTGLIENGNFSYNTDGKSKCATGDKTDCYEIILYWEWVETYHEIENQTSTTDPVVQKKYPARLKDYIDENPTYFFATTPDSNSLEAKSDAYNDGDQLIGDGADCIVLYINAR